MPFDLLLLNERVRKADVTWCAPLLAWNDVFRGRDPCGMLSCWGRNITDVAMGSDDPDPIPFVRPQNYDETVGITTSDRVVLHDGRTLHEYLQGLSAQDTEDAGFKSFHLGTREPETVLVRVQYSWVPVANKRRRVAPMHYSYQTTSDDDPANALLVDTRCGTWLHHDTTGQKKLLAYDGAGEHWHVAEATTTRVGGGGGGGGGVAMGLKGMEPHENVFLVAALPRKQDRAGTQIAYSSLSADASCYRGTNDGISSAARLEVDAEVAGERRRHDVAFERDASQPLWVTLMLFNTVEAPPGGGAVFTPSEEDVRRCVEEGKRIYGLCDHVTTLSRVPEALHALTADHVAAIREKKKTDPPRPEAA